MYRVIVVDDEVDVRSRVISTIKSLNLDIEIVGEFDNGLDAKNAIINDAPDILVTDIKIPYITGIELVKFIAESNYPTKSIIITGFDVFDYAKNAVEYGAASFITKPFTKNDINDALVKVIKILDDEFSLNSTIYKLNEFHNQNLEIIRENDLSRLATIKQLDRKFIEKLQADGVDLSKGNFAMAVIDFDKETTDIELDQYDAIRYSIENILSSTSDNPFEYYTFSRNNRLAILFISNQEIKQLDIERILNPLLFTINRVFSFSFTIGVSSFSNKGYETNFRHLYARACSALDYRAVIGGNQIIFYDDILDQEYKFLNLDENEYKQLIFLLNFDTIEKVDERIDSLYHKISTSDYRYSSYYIALNILNSIIKACNSLSHLYENYLPHNEIIHQFSTLKTPQEMQIFTKKVANEVYKVNNKLKVNSLEKYYHTILRYIEDHYTDPSISLDQLSEGISLSVSYISSLLKSHDTSFVKYLTNLRIEKAKALLANPDNKIIEIAEKVGYTDPYYFSHCFKKTTGLSPREYRQNEIKK